MYTREKNFASQRLPAWPSGEWTSGLNSGNITSKKLMAFERFSDGFVSLIDFFRATCSRIDSSVLNIINFL